MIVLKLKFGLKIIYPSLIGRHFYLFFFVFISVPVYQSSFAIPKNLKKV